MNICLFTPEEINVPLSIRDERGEHLLRILHKKEGDSFTAGIIGGAAGTAVITEINIDDSGKKKDGYIRFAFTPESEGKNLTNLKMIIGFPRPIQLKRLLRDIAGLGVLEVHLTGTDLGEKSYMQSTLVEKGSAYKMLLDGTVQAGSTHVPELFMHKTLEECIENTGDNDFKLCLDNINPAGGLKKTVQGINRKSTVIAAIGSERGWTDRERKLLEQAGYIRCGMGERILRTETAATVAASIILAEMDVLN